MNFKIVFFIAFLLQAACSSKDTKNTISEPEGTTNTDDRIYVTKAQFEHNNMTLGALEDKGFPKVVKTTGMIDVPPENKSIINAMMGGYIKTTPLLIGDEVKKGQQLVTLENPEFITLQQNYLETKEQLSYLKAEYDRQKTMLEEKITSQKNYLKAESDYNTAMARYNGMRKQLSLLNIAISEVEKGNITSIVAMYSPIAGSITKVNVARGTFVSPGTPIMEIIDHDHVHIELSVFEKDIMQLKKGQEIQFTIPEASEERYEAEVYLIGTVIENNRTVKVHGHLKDETKANFLVGMFVQADIITSSVSKKALPEAAVIDLDGVYTILQLDSADDEGYYFKVTEIESENNYNGFSALTDSERFKDSKFLINGAFKLLSGD
tara:strand:+ start:40892 stop:42028 length:1137 start_codon:yes stop_codon:yes gene_type:complete